MTITFAKVSESDESVQALAKASGQPAKVVASAINQARYRTAYNKVKMERDKVLRRLVKEHPELLEGKGE